MMMNFAKDLHRKGELNKVEAMEKLGKKLIKGKDMGLAFITEGFYGFDGLAVIPNKAEFMPYEGYILFDEELNAPKFFKEDYENANE
jgi:hypothetical protein